MHLPNLLRSLRENCPDPLVGCVNLYHKLPLGIWHREDMRRREAGLKALEGSLRLW